MGRDHFQGWRLVILPKWDGGAREVSRQYAPPRFRRAVGYGLLPNLRDSLLSLGESAVLSHLSASGRDQHPRGVRESGVSRTEIATVQEEWMSTHPGPIRKRRRWLLELWQSRHQPGTPEWCSQWTSVTGTSQGIERYSIGRFAAVARAMPSTIPGEIPRSV